VVVAALDFRMPPTAAYPASLADIHYGIRWLKTQGASLHGRADRVGVIGISSGGHQAMLLGMRPADARYAALPLAGGPDARVQAAILCWPVIDPLGRYHRARELQAAGGTYPEAIDRVIPLHRQFWPDEAAMSEGSPALALERGEPAELPPVLYLQGTADQMHPRPHLDRFVAQYRKRGGDLDLALYDGEVEGFINRKPGTPNAVAATRRIIDFVHARLA
jgi:acetyl esterase/lipase